MGLRGSCLFPAQRTDEWYPPLAERAGSSLLRLPPERATLPQGVRKRGADRRVGAGHRRRTPIATRACTGPRFRAHALRLPLCLQPTVITRRARKRGLFDPRYRIGADYSYLANLCAGSTRTSFRYPWRSSTSMPRRTQLNEGHLSTGSTRFDFERDCCTSSRNCSEGAKRGPEIVAFAGEAARRRPGRLGQGNRAEVLRYFGEAKRGQGRRWQPPVVPRAHHPHPAVRIGFTPDSGARRRSDGSSSRNAPPGPNHRKAWGLYRDKFTLKTEPEPTPQRPGAA